VLSQGGENRTLPLEVIFRQVGLSMLNMSTTECAAGLQLAFWPCIKRTAFHFVCIVADVLPTPHPTPPHPLSGYEGEACANCGRSFYRLEGECEPCPKRAYMLIVVFILAIGTECFCVGDDGSGFDDACLFLTVACGAVKLSLAGVLISLMAYARLKGVNLSALGIGVDFLQVVSIFTSFGFTVRADRRSRLGLRERNSCIAHYHSNMHTPQPHARVQTRTRACKELYCRSATRPQNNTAHASAHARMHTPMHMHSHTRACTCTLPRTPTRTNHYPQVFVLSLRVHAFIRSVGTDLPRQLTCCESSFRLCALCVQWPSELVSLFNVASMSSFNEQFLAPECSIGGWGFAPKYDKFECCHLCPSLQHPCLILLYFANQLPVCRWYMMQAVPLVFIVGLGMFSLLDFARVGALLCAFFRAGSFAAALMRWLRVVCITYHPAITVNRTDCLGAGLFWPQLRPVYETQGTQRPR
jgi:hypothetical protein